MRSAAECLCVISSEAILVLTLVFGRCMVLIVLGQKVTHDATQLLHIASDAVVDLDSATTRGSLCGTTQLLQALLMTPLESVLRSTGSRTGHTTAAGLVACHHSGVSS
eukprot:4363671-Amphidinium_carterae.1